MTPASFCPPWPEPATVTGDRRISSGDAPGGRRQPGKGEVGPGRYKRSGYGVKKVPRYRPSRRLAGPAPTPAPPQGRALAGSRPRQPPGPSPIGFPPGQRLQPPRARSRLRPFQSSRDFPLVLPPRPRWARIPGVTLLRIGQGGGSSWDLPRSRRRARETAHACGLRFNEAAPGGDRRRFLPAVRPFLGHSPFLVPRSLFALAESCLPARSAWRKKV
jgi:hypothetical protein